MSCCSDVMKPIEPSSCCTPKDTVTKATERDVCCGVGADNRLASEVRIEEIMRPASACCGTISAHHLETRP